MSNRWPGGVITKTPVTPTGPLQNGTAPGMWSMADAAYWTKQGLWPTAGNFLAVEDVFSTWLYTGNSSTQTITNGIDLAGKGGLVWLKRRDNADNNVLLDTNRGANKTLLSNSTNAENTNASINWAFNSTGFSQNNSFTDMNHSAGTYVSWTFRKAPKFFDVVTYTGDGVAGRAISHNLGVAPGMVIVKRTNSAAAWVVWQRTLSDPSKYLVLNTTAATATDAFGPWGPTGGGYTTNASAFTDTFFRVANDTRSNASGSTYVAYLFAHDTASDGIIQCGSYTTDGSAKATVNLGWEPQWLLSKQSTGGGGNWAIVDSMRGFVVDSGSGTGDALLRPNISDAEIGTYGWNPTATGFEINGGNASQTFIYIAIRRGPMRTPTSGTTVFSPIANTGNSTAKTLTTNFVTDLTVSQGRNAGSGSRATWWDRLRGPLLGVQSWTSIAEASYTATLTGFDNNTGVAVGADGTYGYINLSPDTFATWNFRRAPSFFDEVCYTGTGSTRTINHNLGVAPELMIVKRRNDIGDWVVYAAPLGATKNLYLQAANGVFTNPFWNDTTPTSSVFTIGGGFNSTNASGSTYIAYLFASAPGVSKVGSYTGNGSSQTINCAFTTGARFVMIKRTDSAGDWYVWDSARGIVAGNDPYLALNTTAAEVTTNDSVDTDNTGFIVNQVAASDINVSAATYIFLAVA